MRNFENKTSHEAFAVAFGRNLKQLRVEEGLSQVDVAKVIGVSTSTYANWEQGRREPSIYFVCAIAKALNVNFNILFDLSF